MIFAETKKASLVLSSSESNVSLLSLLLNYFYKDFSTSFSMSPLMQIVTAQNWSSLANFQIPQSVTSTREVCWAIFPSPCSPPPIVLFCSWDSSDLHSIWVLVEMVERSKDHYTRKACTANSRNPNTWTVNELFQYFLQYYCLKK